MPSIDLVPEDTAWKPCSTAIAATAKFRPVAEAFWTTTILALLRLF